MRYVGTAHHRQFAIYRASHDDTTKSLFPTGLPIGLLGVLIATGTPFAAAATAALIYRALGYWAVSTAGTVANAAMARRLPTAPRRHTGPPAAGAREPAKARP